MSIIFNPDDFIPENGFNAAFLTQASYTNLVELVKISINGYDFNGFNFNIQKLPYSYMFISRNPSRFKIGLGKNVNLKITHLGFCKSSLTVIALVSLKNNFTDKSVPHIVISGNRSTSYEFNLNDFKLIPLHAPYTVHGKLGIMPDAVATSQRDTPASQPLTVNKPELTLSVDSSPPPGSSAEEFYQGYKVHKGLRGGKYYYDAKGKRRYLTVTKTSDVVYNINFLSGSKEQTTDQRD